MKENEGKRTPCRMCNKELDNEDDIGIFECPMDANSDILTNFCTVCTRDIQEWIEKSKKGLEFVKFQRAMKAKKRVTGKVGRPPTK